MDRITYNTNGAPGWFDRDRATPIDENTDLDHNGNEVSRATGSQWLHEMLYRTAQGVWVLVEWSQWADAGPVRKRRIADGRAEEWLRRQDLHDTADTYFGVKPEYHPI